MLYLSASDGEIKQSEADAISFYVDVGANLTPKFLAEYIRENNIYSTEFETTVPVTLKIVVQASNMVNDPEGAFAYVGIFEMLGNELISSDYDIDINETKDLNIYLSTLRNYINGNLTCRSNSTTGFVKNGGTSTTGFVKNQG